MALTPGRAQAAGEAAVAELDPNRTETPNSVPNPAPTLDDVARLTPESDYSAFTAPGVDAQVRNEALRKLFHSDPHFGQGDGLDVAVDEVCQIAQSPQARRQKILQARALGLLDDELLEQDPPDGSAPPV